MYTDLHVWLDHFEYHAAHRCVLPETLREDITGYERRLIAKSLARFQLTEQLEAGALLRVALQHEGKHRAAPLARIVQLLIAEEQQHAELLGAFMEQHGLALMIVELVVLAILTFAAIGTDDYWMRERIKKTEGNENVG